MKKILTLNNAFLLVIFCLPFYLIRVSFFGLPSNTLELLALLVTIAVLWEGKSDLLKKIRGIPIFFAFSVLLLFLGIFLSLALNNYTPAGIGVLKGWFIVPIIFSFAIYTQIKNFDDIEKIFSSIYFSSFTVSLIALGYKISGFTTFDDRLSAFYLSPNHLGMYLAPGIIFGLYFLIKSLSTNYFSKKTLLHSAFILTMFLVLYFTHSYASWLALFISLFLCMFFMKIKKCWFLIGAMAIFLLAIIFFVYQKDTEKFSSISNQSSRSSFASRQTIWRVSALLIKENPIFGIGPGNFQKSYLSRQSFFEPYLEWAVPQPHNIFLAFWLQAGLFGMIGFLLILFYIFSSLLITMRKKENIALAMPLFGFFLYTFLHGLADTPYWKNDLSFLFWISVSTLLALSKLLSKK